MPRNTGAQPGAMVTESDKRNGMIVVAVLGLALVMGVAYLFWPIA